MYRFVMKKKLRIENQNGLQLYIKDGKFMYWLSSALKEEKGLDRKERKDMRHIAIDANQN